MIDFSDKWDELRGDEKRSERIRIAPDHHLDLFVGFSDIGNRTFILESPESFSDKNDTYNFENIRIESEVFEGYERLTLELNSNELKDLFISICIDLVNASDGAATLPGAIGIFFNRLSRWAKLLKERKNRGLSESEQLGLLGELSFLCCLLDQTDINKSTLIRGWRGPEGDTKDTTIGSVTTEIKAKLNSSRNSVSISSLDQLEILDRDLYLAVYYFSPAENGLSLASVVDSLIIKLGVNTSEARDFLRKLFLTGFDSDAEYANFFYNNTHNNFYEVNDSFPRLVRSELSPAIIRATYEIDCTQISEHVVEKSVVLGKLNG